MSISSILCLRCDRIGDMLVSTPVLHRLRVLYPEAVITMVASPLGCMALEGNPDIDRVCVYRKGHPLSWRSLVPCLLARHDLVVNFNAASRTLRMLTALARGERKGALNTGRLAPWSGRPEDGEHYSAVMLRELEEAFSLPHDEAPDIRIRFVLPPPVEEAVRAAHPRQSGLRRVGMFIGNIKKQGCAGPRKNSRRWRGSCLPGMMLSRSMSLPDRAMSPCSAPLKAWSNPACIPSSAARPCKERRRSSRPAMPL